MPYCLKCNGEYPHEIERCDICDVYLVDEFPASDSKNPKLLTNTSDIFESESYVTLLDSVGIEAFYHEGGNGGFLKLYTGGSFYGQDIYIEERFYDIAKELIEAPLVEQEDLELE